ncbi:MAG: hypothetical protein PHH11_11900 [Methylomonas sp.]|nr:hypothetical protein [Methylomonas sp.]
MIFAVFTRFFILVLILLYVMEIRNHHRRYSLSYSFHKNAHSAIKTLGACLIAFGSASASGSVVYGGEDFTGIPVYFADTVVSYDPLPDINGKLPNAGSDNPKAALGAPDYVSSGPFYASLGVGGSLVLGFKDRYLTGSGNANKDLWIFEIGLPEAMTVEISKDLNEWFSVGEAKASSGKAAIGIDIDSYGYGPSAFFSYVRLIDVAGDSELRCSTSTDYCFVGADIDAVGIASTAPVPVPTAFWLFGSALTLFSLFGKRKADLARI